MRVSTLAMSALALFLVGCAPGPKSGDGFTLPDGDVEKGKAAFARLQCNACHTVSGVEFESVELTEDKAEEQKIVDLGGETTYVRTYGDLVTSIINPSHRFAFGYKGTDVKTNGESKMRIYNDELTVTELIDLVAFLQSRYKLRAYQPTPYNPYY